MAHTGARAASRSTSVSARRLRPPLARAPHTYTLRLLTSHCTAAAFSRAMRGRRRNASSKCPRHFSASALAAAGKNHWTVIFIFFHFYFFFFSTYVVVVQEAITPPPCPTLPSSISRRFALEFLFVDGWKKKTFLKMFTSCCLMKARRGEKGEVMGYCSGCRRRAEAGVRCV